MPKTLLLADDSVVIQKLVGLSFANEDVQLVTTDNGDDALARARELEPDVVLADIVMPGMSGYEVCEAIKRDPGLQQTPVLLLTGTFEAFDEERARAVGSDGHITKPFEAQALVERINDLLARPKSIPTSAAEPSPMAPSPSTSAPDTAFDFFDDVQSERVDVPSTASTAPDSISAPPDSPMTDAADDVFAFGEPDSALPPLEGSELLADPLDFDAEPNAPAGDRTVALMPDVATRPDLEPAPTVTSLAFDGLDPATAAAGAAPAAEGWDPVSADDAITPLSPASVLPDPADASGGGGPALTTVIMSDGDSSSHGVAVDEREVASAIPVDEPLLSADQPAELLPESPALDSDPNEASTPLEPGSDPLLADDLFGEPAVANPIIERPPEPGATGSVDAFDFGESEAPFGGSQSDPFAVSGPGDVLPPAAAGYDVSSSDLGDPLAQGSTAGGADPIPALEPDPISLEAEAALPTAPVSGPAPLGSTEPQPDALDPMLPDAEPLAEESAAEPSPIVGIEAEPGSDSALQASTAGPDITPVMRARIHETLEKVAWEAFADLSDTIVKQVLQRVEAIAWEVIPQMAEALVKEEIRRMKGEDES